MNQFSELLRRVEITCKARYHASRRMSLHHWLSQWALASLAVGQIVIPLVSALDLNQNFTPEYTTFGSIFFAILLLAYSLLLGMGNYSARAVRTHGCGLELGRLARELFRLQNETDSSAEDYDRLVEKYYDILEKHENHNRGDYLRAYYEYYSATRWRVDDETLTGWSLWRNKVSEWLDLKRAQLGATMHHVWQFSHYVISTFLIWTWIVLLVK